MCKQMMIQIRETEYRSIDFSRQPPHMQSLLKAYREQVRTADAKTGKLRGKIDKGEEESPDAKVSIYKSMGVTPPSAAKRQKRDDELIVIADSPAVVCESPTRPQPTKHYMDWANMVPMRLFPSGALQAGVLKPGASGFAVGEWQDGEPWQTEVPNLQLKEATQSTSQKQVMKRPASKSLWESIDEKTESEGEGHPDDEHEEAAEAQEAGNNLAVDQGHQDQEEVIVDAAEAAAGSPAVDPAQMPKCIRIGAGKLLMTYASKQSYIHLQYKDFSKHFLLSISETRTSEHKRELGKLAKELTDWRRDTGFCPWDDWEAVKNKGLEIRMDNLGY